jgi:hypothetical protein
MLLKYTISLTIKKECLVLTGDSQVVKRHTRELRIDSAALVPPHEGIYNMLHLSVEVTIEFRTQGDGFWRGEGW